MAFPIDYHHVLSEWVSSKSIMQEWPECRQFYLEKLSSDFQGILALPIISCQVVGGEGSDAIPVAAVWSMLRYAADLLDALQDGDNLPETVNDPSIAINYANGLIFSAFDSLTYYQDSYIVQRLTSVFSRMAFEASRGHYLSQQHRLIEYPTLEGYWHSIILKSGSIFRAGLSGGAIVGKAPDKQVDPLGNFGNSLGVIRQIIDDCRDIFQDSKTNKFEVTLPLLLLAEKSDEPVSKLSGDFDSKDALSTALITNHVPEMISSVLLEWHHRAQKNIRVFDQTDEIDFFESILDEFVTKPWLNVSHD